MTYFNEALLNPSSEVTQPAGKVNPQTDISLTITFFNRGNITVDPPTGIIEQTEEMEILNRSAEMVWAEYPENFYAGQRSRYQPVTTTGIPVTVTAEVGLYYISLFDVNPIDILNEKLKSLALVGQVPIRVSGGPNEEKDC